MKKLLSGVVLLFVLLILCTAVADYSEGYFYYTVSDGSVTITGYFGSESHVRVPSTIAGFPVNTIARGAFTKKGISSVTLPDCVTRVEENAMGSGVRVSFSTGATAVPEEQKATVSPAKTAAPTAPAVIDGHEETEDELTAADIEAARLIGENDNPVITGQMITAAAVAVFAVIPEVWCLLD